MSTPICPACRTAISLDTHACPVCRLSVRPTCSACGEALETRMHACPRCWEVIEQPVANAAPSGYYEGAVIEEAAAAAPAPGPVPDQPYEPRYEQPYEHHYEQPYVPAPATTLTQEAPVVEHLPWTPTPQRPRDRRKLRWGRAVLIGIVAGVLVAAGLVILDAFAPRIRGNEPDQIDLVREAFPDHDFAISSPRSWDVRPQRVNGLSAVTFIEPVREGAERRFRVTLDNRSLDRARQLTGGLGTASGREYDEINIIDGVQIDGRKAFRHIYTLRDDYREAWWVERGSRTYRIDFWAPLSRREESAQLYVRIARTLDAL